MQLDPVIRGKLLAMSEPRDVPAAEPVEAQERFLRDLLRRAGPAEQPFEVPAQRRVGLVEVAGTPGIQRVGEGAVGRQHLRQRANSGLRQYR